MRRKLLLSLILAVSFVLIPISGEASLWKVLTARWGSGAGEIDQVRMDASTNSLQTIEYEHHEIHSGSSYYLEGHVQLEDTGTTTTRVKLMTPVGTKWGHFTWSITSNGITEINHYEGPTGGMANGSRGVIHANNRNKNCWSGEHTAAGSSDTILTDSTASWVADELIGKYLYNSTDGSGGTITGNTDTTVTVDDLLLGTGNTFDQYDSYEINDTIMRIETGVDAPTRYGLLLAGTKFGGTGFKADVGGGTTRAHEIITKPGETYMFEIISSSAANIITYSVSWYEHTDKH